MLPVILDPRAHRPYRVLLNSSLAPQVVKGMEGRIRDFACAPIEGFHASGHCNFTDDYAEMLPVQIVMSMQTRLPRTSGRSNTGPRKSCIPMAA